MSAAELNPLACAAFLVVAFSVAGLAQAIWLSSPASSLLAWPLDCGATFRGRRLFGPNKTLRGFVVMIPATSAAFALVRSLGPAGPWPLTVGQYAILGAVAGAGFMAAELPNSFIKRQLLIPAGAEATAPSLRQFFGVIDHLDSVCGALGAMALIVAVPVWTAVYVVAIGWLVHRGFSQLTFRLGGKARAA